MKSSGNMWKARIPNKSKNTYEKQGYLWKAEETCQEGSQRPPPKPFPGCLQLGSWKHNLFVMITSRMGLVPPGHFQLFRGEIWRSSSKLLCPRFYIPKISFLYFSTTCSMQNIWIFYQALPMPIMSESVFPNAAAAWKKNHLYQTNANCCNICESFFCTWYYLKSACSINCPSSA